VAVGLTGGSGSVAVGGLCRAWLCGHFDRRQVGNRVAVAAWQWVAVGGSGWLAGCAAAE
jgi:hypothetical protein